MQLKWISGIALAFLLPMVNASDEKSLDVNELDTNVVFKPASCPYKSAKGDKLAMHYVSGTCSRHV